MLDIYLPWLSLLVSVLLPALVALVTKRYASSSLKAIVLIFLAAGTGLLTEFYNAASRDEAFNWNQAFSFWATSFVVAVVAHYGLLKPTNITGTEGGIQVKTARVGLGAPQRQHLAR